MQAKTHEAPTKIKLTWDSHAVYRQVVDAAAWNKRKASKFELQELWKIFFRDRKAWQGFEECARWASFDSGKEPNLMVCSQEVHCPSDHPSSAPIQSKTPKQCGLSQVLAIIGELFAPTYLEFFLQGAQSAAARYVQQDEFNDGLAGGERVDSMFVNDLAAHLPWGCVKMC